MWPCGFPALRHSEVWQTPCLWGAFYSLGVNNPPSLICFRCRSLQLERVYTVPLAMPQEPAVRCPLSRILFRLSCLCVTPLPPPHPPPRPPFPLCPSPSYFNFCISVCLFLSIFVFCDLSFLHPSLLAFSSLFF